MTDEQRIAFLKRENEALNRHKGELIDKVWELEAEIRRVKDVVREIYQQADSPYTVAQLAEEALSNVEK